MDENNHIYHDQGAEQLPVQEGQQIEKTSPNTKLVAGVAAVLGVLVAVGVGAYFYTYQTSPEEVACTQEAKICPDGTAVRRTGPNCEFAQCPPGSDVGVDTSDWKTYRNEEYGFEVKYPPDWEVSHDSYDPVLKTIVWLVAKGAGDHGPVIKIYRNPHDLEAYSIKELETAVDEYQLAVFEKMGAYDRTGTYQSEIQSLGGLDVVVAKNIYDAMGVDGSLIEYYALLNNGEIIQLFFVDNDEYEANRIEKAIVMSLKFIELEPELDTSNWKTYRNEEYGFEFRYPSILNLFEEDGKVILHHSIPYKNYGDCDMMGGEQLYKTLDDFNVSFEVANQKLSLSYIDGEYSAGILKGSWAYEGAEGCGHSEYHFSIGENETLVVQRAAIQALSGLSTLWDLEKILKVPGAISKEESKKIFDQILSTFKFIE